MNHRKNGLPPTQGQNQPRDRQPLDRQPSAARSQKPGAAQAKMAGTPPQKTPASPPVYRPHPQPQALQTKLTNGDPNRVPPRINSTGQSAPRIVQPQPHAALPQPHAALSQTRTALSQPHAALPQPCSALSQPRVVLSQPRPALTQPKANAAQAKPIHPRIRQTIPAVARPSIQRKVVQLFKSSVVQAVKFYPNLHPGAAVPVERSNIFSLDNFANQYRLHRVGTHSVNVPNLKYNFVRTREGQTLLHNRYRHPSLAEGQQVLYAGEVFFNNGRLEWWSNGSGHYQPDADGAEQANLPLDSFYTYQQVIKGEHTRGRRG
jgi:hypothetical protein